MLIKIFSPKGGFFITVVKDRTTSAVLNALRDRFRYSALFTRVGNSDFVLISVHRSRPKGAFLQPRTLLRNRLPNLLHEPFRAHVLRLFFPARPHVHPPSLDLFISHDQQERHLLHG